MNGCERCFEHPKILHERRVGGLYVPERTVWVCSECVTIMDSDTYTGEEWEAVE